MAADKVTCKEYLRLMGKKVGMTRRFDDKGLSYPCTVLHLEPNVVVQVKTNDKDGYQALQLGYDEFKCKEEGTVAKRTTKPVFGHFKKQGVKPRKKLKESRVSASGDYEVGQAIGVEYFEEVSHVDATAVSKGKGYQGVMKRHGFRGGPASHGSGFHRHGGSTGMRSTPGRCFKGQKKAGQMGNVQVTVQSLKVLDVMKEENILVVKGSVPGAVGSVVTLSPAVKKR